MKKFTVYLIVVAAFLILTLGASANTAATLRVSVPFAFHVNNDVLPPGGYLFEIRAVSPFSASSSAVLIRTEDGSVAAWVMTTPGSDLRSASTDCLHFNQYGNKYFLSKVECANYQANLRKAAAEKELLAGAQRGKDTILVALK